MSEDFAGFSREELEEYAGHITEENEKQKEEIDALNGEIKDLTRELVGKKGRRSTTKDADLAAELENLEEKMGKVRDKLAYEQAQTSKLKDKLADSEAAKTQAVNSKSESDAKIKEQTKRIDDLGKELLKAMSVSKNAEIQSKESNKVKGDTVKETRRLLEENEQLQNELKELTAHLKLMDLEKSALEEAITQIAEDRDEIEAHKEAAVLNKEELQSRVSELEQHLEQTQDKLQVAGEAESVWQNHVEVLHQDHTQKVDKMSVDMNSMRKEIKVLKAENAVLKDSTLIGEKQREIEALHAEHEESLLLLREMGLKLEGAINDRDQLAERLSDDDAMIEERMADRVVAEREKLRALETKMRSIAVRTSEDAAKYKELEIEKNFLSNEVDDLMNWKAVYESGHGLQELARNQRSLKGDKRLLSLGLEQMTSKYGAAQDSIGTLKHAFDKLKKESGKPPDFMYPELELEQEMLGENARLQSQLLEAEDQISALELENTRVRKAMKNQAGNIGEQGFKFQGMDSESLVIVNEFASNLREGKVDLPLTDRSVILLKENRKLKDEQKATNLRLERYERELSGIAGPGSIPIEGSSSSSVSTQPQIQGGGGGGLSRIQEAELFGLRNDVQKLLSENDSLHGRMTSMQAELMYMMRMKMQDKEDSSESNNKKDNEYIASALMAANESLMRELIDLKAANRDTPRNIISSMGDAELPQNQQGYSSSGQQGSFQNNYQSSPMMGSAAGSGGTGLKYNSRLPPAGGRKPSSNTANFAGTPRSLDNQPEVMYTPGPRSSGNVGTSNFSLTGGGGGGGGFGAQEGFSVGGPSTPHGKTLFAKNLNQMNLPPEEWALEVKELNGQLVECLEQLYEREEELEEQRSTVASLEENLVFIKQQMAAVYHDFSLRSAQWELKEKNMREETTLLKNDRDDSRLQLKRTEEILAASADSGVQAEQFIKLGRKVVGHEVRELRFTRLNTSITEQLKEEQNIRQQAEHDFVEMESTLKKRILFLEQYKAAVGAQMGRLQGKLDGSVPQDDYQAVQDELECLRSDHLITLRREVEARIAALKSLEQAHELRALHLSQVHLQADLHKANTSIHALNAEISHQKEVTRKAMSSVNSPSELASVISEMARYRGEASRLEVEVAASRRKYDLLEGHLRNVTREAEDSGSRIKELEDREESANAQESETRRAAAALSITYVGGLKSEEAIALKAKLEASRTELEASQRDCVRYRELSEIASMQAQTIGTFKQQHLDELSDLKGYCAKLESQGDDELLIGKLQRQLMSTKTSYKAFVRKYQFLRGNMRQRELAMRVLETRLDERDAAVLSIQETHRLEISALKKALRSMHNIAAEDIDITNTSTGSGSKKAGAAGGVVKQKTRGTKGLVSIGDKLLHMSDKVNSLSILAEGAVTKATIAEEESRKTKGISQDLAAEKDLLLQRCSDLEAACKGPSKQQTIASRLVSLSEDVRIHKLATMQQRREIQVLRQEKKHLQNVLATMEADVEDLEEGQVRAETKNLLLDIPSDSTYTASSYPGGKGVGSKMGYQSQNKEQKTQKTGERGGGGGGLLDDTLDDYKRLRGDLLIFSEMEDEEGCDEKKDGSRSEPGRDSKSRKTQSNAQNSNDELFSNPENLENVPPEALIKKIEQLNSNLSTNRKDMSDLRLKSDRLQNALSECEAALQEMERHVTYYEGVMANEGLPDIKGNQRTQRMQHGQGQGGNSRNGKQNFTVEDQENMQEAATATMTSMRQLLDEKNRMIEKYREKLEDVRNDKRPKSAADRKADDLLERLTQDTLKNSDRRNGPNSTGDSGPGTSSGMNHPEAMHAQNRLLDQIEQADQLLNDKDRTIQQLEQKLLSQENQRERAEIRCGTGIKEMEAMKADMILLARQLQASESKYTAHTQKLLNDRVMSGPSATPLHSATSSIKPTAPAPIPDAVPDSLYRDVPDFDNRPKEPLEAKINDLQKSIKGKNEKIKGYRDVIIRLKEEFIKLEEDKAVAAAALKDKVAKSKIDNERDNYGSGQGRSRGRDNDAEEGGGGALGEQAMKELRGQIAALRDGLRLAKEDLEKARQTRERLNTARQAAQEESDRLESQVGRAEAQAAAAQEALVRTRKELEETRKREVRLRDKLKDFIDGESGSKVKDIKEAITRIEHLENETEVLRAQNLILRKASAAADRGDDTAERGDQTLGARVGRYGDPVSPMKKDPSGGQVLGYGAGKGNILGRGGDEGDRGRGRAVDKDGEAEERQEGKEGNDAFRQQLHNKWEGDKKTQKRLLVLEKRLQAQVDEVADLTGQLKKARDIAQTATSAKEDMVRKMNTTAKSVMEPRKGSLEEIGELEEGRSKVFRLEEENSKLQRRVEIEFPNEIASLRHQLSIAHVHEEEVKEDLEAMKERLRKSGAEGGRSIRDSEDRSMREDRLREGLERSRKQRLDLEAALLDRDSRAMEHRFDLEAKQQDVERMRKRVKELEAAYRNVVSLTGANEGKGGMGSRTAWEEDGARGRGKRERELEGVIEAMKKVIDKIKLENDRLRKGVGTNLGVAGAGAELKGESDKKNSADKNKSDRLEEEMKSLYAKLKTYEESGQKLLQRQQQVTTMRKQMKTKDDELKLAKESVESLSAEKEAFRRKATAAEGRVQQLEVAVQQARQVGRVPVTQGLSSGGERDRAAREKETEKELVELRIKAAEDREDGRALRSQLLELKNAMKEQEERGRNERDRDRGSERERGGASASETKRLKEENEKLRQELAAFDLDFFEEIENLKYAHSEAVKKLWQYEGGRGR